MPSIKSLLYDIFENKHPKHELNPASIISSPLSTSLMYIKVTFKKYRSSLGWFKIALNSNYLPEYFELNPGRQFWTPSSPKGVLSNHPF